MFFFQISYKEPNCVVLIVQNMAYLQHVMVMVVGLVVQLLGSVETTSRIVIAKVAKITGRKNLCIHCLDQVRERQRELDR